MFPRNPLDLRSILNLVSVISHQIEVTWKSIIFSAVSQSKKFNTIFLGKVLTIVDILRSKLAITVFSLDSNNLRYNTVKKYKFRDKEFECDEMTISKLNYALAKNKAEERYVEVE